MTRRAAVAVCIACAVLHLVPPVASGASDGDHSLLLFGGPLAGATALAAAALSTGGSLGRLVAVVLTAVVASCRACSSSGTATGSCTCHRRWWR